MWLFSFDKHSRSEPLSGFDIVNYPSLKNTIIFLVGHEWTWARSIHKRSATPV